MQREVERELRVLDREEQKLIADIKKAAKDGNEVRAATSRRGPPARRIGPLSR